MQKGFLFDINKCVACHACVVACQIENVDFELLVSEEFWKQQLPWRTITTQNKFQYPEFPVFNFSMACNHCEDAPCMRNCPAFAYVREKKFGAVIHQAEACIGCQYCIWVCPYDAPKYNPVKGIVEKCTLCIDRLSESKKPACASSCPTGALDYNTIKLEPQFAEGFSEVGIKPRIEIKSLRTTEEPKCENFNRGYNTNDLIQRLNLEDKKIRNLLTEWSLLVFSLLTPILVAAFYSSYSKGIALNIELFCGVAVLSGILSIIHLGKKFRAWRVFLNVWKSWLSREIFAYILFVSAALLWLISPSQNELGLIATLFGLLTLLSIDNVYRQIPFKAKNKYHSADVLFFTVFLYVAILVSNPWMFFAAIALKSYLYITRKMMFKKEGKDIRPFLSGLRLLLGFAIPLVLFFVLGFDGFSYLVLIFVILGELIDRMEFYLEL